MSGSHAFQDICVKTPLAKLPGENLNLLISIVAISSLNLTVFLQPAFAESNPSLAQESYLNLPEEEKQAPLTEALDAELSFSLTGRRYDDAIVNSRWGRAAIGIDLKKKFTSYLSGRLAIEQRFTSGAASNYYTVTDGGASPQGTLIDEAALTLKPADYFKASTGIVSVGMNPIYSVMNSQSWLAGKMESDIKLGSHSLTLQAAQATPSSGGVSNRTVDDGTLPLFTQGTVMGELNPFESVRFRAAYTSYVFTDPSARTAEDSKFNGSTVLGNGPYIFAYDYKGAEVAADVQFTLFLDDRLTFKAAQIRNDKAPEKMNQGDIWKAEYQKKFNRYEVTGALSGFRIESDAIPSSYGVELMGFSNRAGHSTTVRVRIPKQHLGIMVGHANANVLNKAATASGTQADREVYTIKTELTYDLF